MKRARLPSWVMVTAAVVMAFPFGWGVGLLAAYIIAGKEVGQLPAATVPLGLLGALAFAVSPTAQPTTRFKILSAGAVLLVALAWLVA